MSTFTDDTKGAILGRRSYLAMLFCASLLGPHGQALANCAAPENPIVAENCQPGSSETEWDVSGAGDSSIQGYATQISVDRGQTVFFKVKTNATNYQLDIYRLGYYGGMGARKVDTVLPSAALPQTQPNCLSNASTGLIDCGNWAISASWVVPANAVSGIYFALLIRNDNGGASHIVFVVRDDTSTSDLLFQTSDTTWQAYNSYGGNSLYVGSPAGRAYKVSYNRPFNTRSVDNGQDWLFNAEYPMVRWLEANGYDVSYFTGVDSDRRGNLISNHKAFLSVGHDEYWSGGQRANVESARNAGVHLAFFSGNEVFWKTRWENSIDGSGTTYRTLVCYKETHANAVIDPQDPPTWTGTWRDPRFSPPADGGRPENELTGTIFTVNGSSASDAIKVPEADGKMRFWRNTTVATLTPGAVATLAGSTLGYEWDEDLDNGFRPPALVRLSSTTINGVQLLQDHGSTYAAGTATHRLTLYKHGSGALVFGAGTVQWSWGLDSNHDRGSNPADARMRQATVNLFADMGVQPAMLQAGLVTAVASTDTTAPTSTISSPISGSNVPVGSPMTISGTATDAGGGVVGGVEVSVDGGATWFRANGRSNWSFSWFPSASGSVTIRSRAVDDSGNLGTPGAGVNVTVGGGGGGSGQLVAAYAFAEGSGTSASDATDNGHTGTVSGATWSTSGRFNNALSFDGTNDLVTVADEAGLDLTTGMTLEAWVNPSALSGWQTVIMKERPGGLAYTLYAHDNAPRPSAYINTGGGDAGAIGATGLPLNTWTHLAVTYDGATLRLFVNGAQAGSKAASGSIISSTSPLRIGGNSIWGEYFAGLIDEVRIYSRVLTAAEIQTDMNTPVGAPPPTDATPPTLTSTTPASGATGVSPGTAVTAVFNEAMDATTVNASTFELRDATNGLVAATVTYNASTRTATLTPSSVLANGATYTATVKGGATDPRVKDVAGNALAANQTWSFTIASADTNPPTVTAATPASGATGVGVGTPVTATFSEAMDPATVNTSTFELRDGADALVAAAVTYNASGNTATLTPSSALANGVTYTATVKGGTTDPRVKDLAGNALAANLSWSFTTATSGACTGNTIWPATVVPAVAADPDTSAVELGVKFRSDVNGTVCGVRFYKGSANTGTHVGKLWSSGGTLLAQATFTGETASGWQQVNFTTPVAITAGTTYVASYHAPNGRYAVNQGYFTTGVDTPPLHALQDGVSGGNGVHLYGAGGFPINTFASSNYWVDLAFIPGTAPTLASIAVTPTNPTIQTSATQQFTATGNYSDSSTQNITTQVAWASSNTAVATINSAGLATAGTSTGTTAISATSGTVSGNTTLTVQTAPPITSTGFLAPSANAAVTSGAGDNNGFQTTPSNAYVTDGLFAVDTNSGTNTNTSCTNAGKDKHSYFNYNFIVPSGVSIRGIEVRLDARAESALNSPKMCAQLSWNGGTSWTTALGTTALSTATTTYILGGATNTWGRTWTVGDFSNANFRVRIIDVASSTARDFSLDGVVVQVTYQ